MNGALVIALTAALPIFNFVSSIILIMLALKLGARVATLQAGAAAAFIAVASLIGGSSAGIVVFLLALNWAPAMLLAAVLLMTRSLVLTAQVSVIVAITMMLAFYAIVTDVEGLWLELIDLLMQVWRDAGQDNLAAAVEQQKAIIAQYATPFSVAAAWMVQAGSLVLGYLLYRQLPEETIDFGRFRDLNFGRVLAVSLAVISVAGTLLNVIWLQGIAFVLLAAFWLQGVAIGHWLHAEKLMRVSGVVAMYVLMLLFARFVIPALAVIGYIDAWFGFRRRIAAKRQG